MNRKPSPVYFTVSKESAGLRQEKGCLRSWFASTPPPMPEEPYNEPPDPSAGRKLASSYRSARRVLILVSALSTGWSAAQFSLREVTVQVLGFSVSLENAAIPLLLGLAQAYMTVRWGLEFAMMPRHVRRWRLAQWDFRLGLMVTRFALLAVAAGAVDRSLETIARLVIVLACLAGASIMMFAALLIPLTFWRMRAREKTGRISATAAVAEAMAWSGMFGVGSTALFVTGGLITSYVYEPLSRRIWEVRPSPVAITVFLFVLVAIFLSHWLLRPMLAKLFGERRPYRTSRNSEGQLIYKSIGKEQEPLV